MALEGIKHAVSESLHKRVEDLKASPEEGVKGVVGGIADATALNVWKTLGDVLKGPVWEVLGGIAQPVARTALAAKELATLHPGKSIAQLALGAEKLAEHAVGVVRTGVETIANTINRLMRGTARAVAGVVGENIFGDRYKDIMEEIKVGIEALGTGKPAGETPLFGTAAASHAEH